MYTFSSSTLMTSNESRKIYIRNVLVLHKSHSAIFWHRRLRKISLWKFVVLSKASGHSLSNSSEIWRRSKGHWHFSETSTKKSKNGLKTAPHTCFQSVWPWKDGGYHSYGKLCLLLQNSFWSFAATAKNLEEEVPEKRIVNRKRDLDRQVRLQQMPSRPSVIGGRQEQRRK